MKPEWYLEDLMKRYPILSKIRQPMEEAYQIMKQVFENDKKLLIAGNGGSAADSGHIAGEMMKRFQIARPVPKKITDKLKEIDLKRGKVLSENLEQALMAIPLIGQEALMTAYMNDVDCLGVFAQQLYGYARAGDVFLGISTSGNSENIIYAAITAKAMGIKVIALTGNMGGELAQMADCAVIVPETEVYKIQELHLPIYHCWCHMLELYFFGGGVH